MKDKGIKFAKFGDNIEALAKFLVALELNGAAYFIDDFGDYVKVYVTGG